MTWAKEQRLRFIDFLLAEYGTLNRSALMNYYGISVAQASNDISRYMAMAPGAVFYDHSAKLYRTAPTFKRVWK